MSDSDKCKTTEIRAFKEEIETTGLISSESVEREHLIAEEKIEQLRRLYREKVISHNQLSAGIRAIRQELTYRIDQLNI